MYTKRCVYEKKFLGCFSFRKCDTKHKSVLLVCTHLKQKNIKLRLPVDPSWLASFCDFSASCIVCTCCETAESILSSSRLNSSKQPHAPTWQRPTKIRPIAWKSKVSSQLNTSTKRPSWLPRAFTDSVFPVPAGPTNKIVTCGTAIFYNVHLCNIYIWTPDFLNSTKGDKKILINVHD